MNKTNHTIIHFDYGGRYLTVDDEEQWVSRAKIRHAILIKKPRVDVTYADMVGEIRRKMGGEEDEIEIKLSYLPEGLFPKSPIYISDDDGVMCYFCTNDMQGISVLHVEIENVVEYCEEDDENVGFNQLGREECILSSNNVPLVPNEVLDEERDEEREDEREEEIEEVGLDQFDGYEGNEVGGREERLEIGNGEWEDGIDLTLGQKISKKEDLRTLVERSAHGNCFDYDVVKNDLTRYVLKCCEAKNGCKWGLRAAKHKDSDWFTISKYTNVHVCSRTTTSTRRHRRKGTKQLVASLVNEDFAGQLDTPKPNSLIGMVQGKVGVKVSYSTAWRGRQLAASLVRGTPKECYKNLYNYMYMLQQVNPGTVTYVEVDDERKFKYCFFALGACIEGFRYMRQVIIVDATHLKTSHGGVLVVATTQDPNHHHYPIAFGILDGEKDASWSWFFKKLKTVVCDADDLVFISDRNQSLIKAIYDVYPFSKHGYCIYHLSQNVKNHSSNVEKDTVAVMFRECAQAYTEADFKSLYATFKKRFPAAGKYLDRSTVEAKWARCYFPGERYNMDMTNPAESMNNVLREARQYSLLSLIDAIVGKLGEWFNKYRKTSSEPIGNKIVPHVDKLLDDSLVDATKLLVVELNSFELQYNVIGRDGRSYFVYLRMKTCSCRRFDIDRYPCEHAIAALLDAKRTGCTEMNLIDLCSKYYTTNYCVMAYYRTIFPVPHISQWMVPDHVRDFCVLEPDHIKKRGRKQIRRFPSVGEYRRRGSTSTSSQSTCYGASSTQN